MVYAIRDFVTVRRTTRVPASARSAVRRSGAGARLRRTGASSPCLADDRLGAPLQRDGCCADGAHAPGAGFPAGIDPVTLERWYRASRARTLRRECCRCGSREPVPDEWLSTPLGMHAATSSSHALELWFHTAQRASRLPVLLEGSKPGDRRLGRVTFATATLHRRGVTLGVRQFSFTAASRSSSDLVRILVCAGARAVPGADQTCRRGAEAPGAARAIAGTAPPLALRVSIDYPERARHDAGRGEGNFLKAWAALALCTRGLSRVDRAADAAGENPIAVEDAYGR